MKIPQGSSVTLRSDFFKQAPASDAGTAAPSRVPMAYHYGLSTAKPVYENAGSSITSANKKSFPAVVGQGASILVLRLAPGALREPHWHPNGWEIGYVISGAVEITVLPPDAPADVFTLPVGDTWFIPVGFGHAIANHGEVEAVMSVVFNTDDVSDIGLAAMFAEFPAGQFESVLGVPAAALSVASKTNHSRHIVPKT